MTLKGGQAASTLTTVIPPEGWTHASFSNCLSHRIMNGFIWVKKHLARMPMVPRQNG